MNDIKKLNIDFLWSKGLYNRTEYMLNKTTSQPNEKNIINLINNADKYIWIRNNIKHYDVKDIDLFAKNIHLLKRKIFIITGDSDMKVPSCYKKESVDIILSNENITNWFTQNYDGSIIHDKLKHFPIGLDLHTQRWLIEDDPLKKINFYIEVRNSNVNIINNKIFCDSHLKITNKEREKMYEILKKNPRIDFLESLIGFENIIKKYKEYKFVLSPEGNGLDCHRTWELFLLGCIVITKSSSLNQMWIENDLPVIIIEDWNELNNGLKIKLKEWYIKYNKFTDYNHIIKRFKYNYWLPSK